MNYSKLKSILFNEECKCDKDRTKIKSTARPEDKPRNKILSKQGNIQAKIIDETDKKKISFGKKKTKIIINPVKQVQDNNSPNDSYIDTVGGSVEQKLNTST